MSLGRYKFEETLFNSSVFKNNALAELKKKEKKIIK